MPLVIKKRVSLDFLGDDYKDSYLIFKAIPIKDFEVIQKDIDSIENDNFKSITLIVKTLKKYFLSGKGPNEEGIVEDLTEKDIDEIDQEAAIKCFQIITGQNIGNESDFLDKGLTNPSPTDQSPQSNS